jgi:hydrogenase maturation protein HypF
MRYRLTLTGVVQGVGFRPFVKRLADRVGVPGRIWNTGGGVVIDVECAELKAFLGPLHSEAPANARIVECAVEGLPEVGYQSFDIVASELAPGAFTLISPDLATCPDCLREILDPTNRRHGYPFTNCTNCGPRYSIIRAVPYDRPNTTMASFTLCSRCRAEYNDPSDRRFHAEPNACPVCGPRLTPDLDEAVAALAAGCIVAVKSLGGFQLACNAFRNEAVARLRAAKRRSRKPFAAMARDLAAVERWCEVTAADRALLCSRAAPITLLRMRDPRAFPPDLAPGLRELGVMLPYTPLHHLLFQGLRSRGPADFVVMTSGNVSEEPIVISNQEAAAKLGPMCDLILTHDRDIFMRVDDSVVRGDSILRRARGFAPDPIDLGFDAGEVLATGGELKNTFCLVKGRYAVLSQHIGDLENWETLQFFEETLRNLKSVYRAAPRLIAHDLHPDYLGTRWALRQPEPKLAVQHHHAHIASCMAEHGLRGSVIGVAFDGTGYGADGQIWGGEFLLCSSSGFERAACLRPVPLPGGDPAARESRRMAAAYLWDAFGPGWRAIDLGIPETNHRIFEKLYTSPATIRTSSCGRLFDAVSSLTGICFESSYEGEAPMLLEAAAFDEEAEPYAFVRDKAQVDTRPIVRGVCADMLAGVPPGRISSRFHSTLAGIIESVCVDLREQTGLNQVCMSGGTFQNATLCSRTRKLLERRGFTVYTHRKVPANDGGLALGQALIAARRLSLCA